MRYMGGKFNLGKHLAPYILRHNPDRIIEPFLGGANFTTHIFNQGFTGEYIAGDFNEDVNYMWKCVINDGWLPKIEDRPTLEQYNAEKNTPFYENPLRGFMRTAASFGGNPWASYALDLKAKPGAYQPDFWGGPVRGITKQYETLKGKNISIMGGDYSIYRNHLTASSVVYCDPPYVDTANYTIREKFTKNTFNIDEFWQTMSDWSKVCPVYVSELSAPEDWVAVYSKDMSHFKRTGASEKLFIHQLWANKLL